MAPTGIFDACIFLPPKKHPHVVAWNIHWLSLGKALISYQKQCLQWLHQRKYEIEKRKFFPHVSIARSPFEKNQWKKVFSERPFLIRALHLYESVGGLHYVPQWTRPFIPAFEEVKHTTGKAFHIYGENLQQIYTNAQVALAFQ